MPTGQKKEKTQKQIEAAVNKQEAQQTVPPPAWMRDVLEQAKREPTIEPGKNLDDVLYEGSNSDFWKFLKDYMNGVRMGLGTELKEKALTAGLEEIGYRFLLLDTVDSIIKNIINRVEVVVKIRTAAAMKEAEKNEKREPRPAAKQ